ncbi:hypothetical protein EJ110_NYTH40587 [Nymphaea thermarum]|nr:hypothetical protein EJ110_NYTH40587 [Nymphaea thermarum]
MDLDPTRIQIQTYLDIPAYRYAVAVRRYVKSILSNLIQEIEPLDISLIQKDVSAETIDAMKRTISGMLGLLPSDQFHVLIEAFWEPLSRLLVSSMMTGYTLRNAEYSLCLQRNIDVFEDPTSEEKQEELINDNDKTLPNGNTKVFGFLGENKLSAVSDTSEKDPPSEKLNDLGLGEMAPEAQEYILHLQSRLSSAKHELHDIRRKNNALQMQHFAGEEKNTLLDYLRSLDPEKVAELSEPTSLELQETIHSVIHGLLATLSPKMQTKPPKQSGNVLPGIQRLKNEDSAETIENTPLQFQPLISVTRDYLARLLFWCMLLGHYLRGLEYRLELMELLSLSKGPDSNASSAQDA